MHLNTFAHGEIAGKAGLRLGRCDIKLCLGMAFIEQGLRLQHDRTRAFHLAIKMRGAVLERLELTDQPVELLTLFQIIEGHVHRASAHADHFSRCADASGIEHLAQYGPATIDFAYHRIGIDLNAIELYVRRHSRVDEPRRFHRHSARVLLHRKQCQTVGFSRRASGPRRDNQHVR
jgi:hypothetical protein